MWWIRKVLALTFSTRSFKRIILLPLRAATGIVSRIFAPVASYVAKIFLGFNLLPLFLQDLHERLSHSLLGLLVILLHQGIKLTLNWDMVYSFTQEASNLTCEASFNWTYGMTMGPLIRTFFGRMSYLSTSFACL